MKKNIFIVVFAVFSLLLAACNPQENLDPRETEWSTYRDAILKLSKSYADKNAPDDDAEKSFDVYLAYFFLMTPDIYLEENCADKIEKDYQKYERLFFNHEAKSRLQSYCAYDVKNLMALGNAYAEKTKSFDYNNLNAMYFYYNAHRKALNILIDSDENLPDIENLTTKSYETFKAIRHQLPSSYIELSNYTPFDPNDAQDF